MSTGNNLFYSHWACKLLCSLLQRCRHPGLLYSLLKAEFFGSLFYWRWFTNTRYTFSHQLDPRPPKTVRALVERIHVDGIAFNTFYDSASLQDNLQKISHHISSEVDHALVANNSPHATRTTYSTKNYNIDLLPESLDLNSPLLQFALDPEILLLSGHYLGTRPYLREVELILTLPSESKQKESQLWHRDGDDLLNLKFFIYFTHVSQHTGPLQYITGSHRFGKQRGLGIDMWEDRTRVSDRDMATMIPEPDWVSATGPPLTSFITDTSGYHKGGFVQRGHRVALILHYTSAMPLHPRRFQITGDIVSLNLSPLQSFALRPD